MFVPVLTQRSHLLSELKHLAGELLGARGPEMRSLARRLVLGRWSGCGGSEGALPAEVWKLGAGWLLLRLISECGAGPADGLRSCR